MNLSWLAVFVGGGLGSLCRFAISMWVGKPTSGFPFATFYANLLSCLILGIAWFSWGQRLDLPQSLKLMVMVGFCGGFSTFSTFSLETLILIQSGKFLLAAIYVLSSVMACLILLYLIHYSIK